MLPYCTLPHLASRHHRSERGFICRTTSDRVLALIMSWLRTLLQNAGLVVKIREDSAPLRSNGESGEDTGYGILRPKRRNAFLIGSLWTTSD